MSKLQRIAAIIFPIDPPLGTTLVLSAGQTYRLDRIEPYRRKDGHDSALLHWSATCPDSGEEFTVITGLTIGGGFSRRALGHRKPGRRVASRTAASSPLDKYLGETSANGNARRVRDGLR